MTRVREYTDPDCVKFVEEVREAGLTPTHYNGRYFWSGPAVEVDDLAVGIRATTVDVQWDNLGLGFIVYPVARDEGREPWDARCPICEGPNEFDEWECPVNAAEVVDKSGEHKLAHVECWLAHTDSYAMA